MLYYRETLEVTFACEDIDFTRFPIDKHFCSLIFGDFEHMAHRLQYDYTEFEYDFFLVNDSLSTLSINDSTTPFDFTLSMIKPFTRENTKGNTYYFTGINFNMTRKNIGSLLTTFYAPTGIFTVFSMMSFLIKPESVPGRMGMIVTLQLITINIYIALEAPSNRKFSYVELWFIGCQVPSLISLIEYGLILILMRNENPVKSFKKMDMITLFSCILFFISFNVCYWTLIL